MGLGDFRVGFGDCLVGFGLDGFRVTENLVGIIVGYGWWLLGLILVKI